MGKNLFCLLVIAAATVYEVYSCNTKQNFGTPTQKPSFLQSLKDAGKLQANNLQHNKDSNKPDDGKTVILYGKAQEHDHQSFYQHPYRSEGKEGGTEKGLADVLFPNDQTNGFKSGSSFQYSAGNDIKNPNFGTGNLFKTPLANDYKKGPGFQIQEGIFKENQPESQFKNAFPTEFTNKENSNGFNSDSPKDNGGSQFGYNKGQGPIPGFSITSSGDNGNKGPRPLIQLPITTQQTPEIFKAIDFLPKPEAQKQELVETNHANNGHIKNIADQLNFNHFNLFNSPTPSFDGGNNNLDFNDNSQNYNGPFNNFNEQRGNSENNGQSVNHQQSRVPLTGFYNINDPSGSWRNIDYNAGPTGFYANVQKSTNHDGHGTSYGDFKTFGTIQNFGL